MPYFSRTGVTSTPFRLARACTCGLMFLPLTVTVKPISSRGRVSRSHSSSRRLNSRSGSGKATSVEMSLSPSFRKIVGHPNLLLADVE